MIRLASAPRRHSPLPLALALTVQAILLGALVVLGGCGNGESTAKDARYLSVFSVRETQDDTHKRRMTLPNGDAWFVADPPALTLDDVDWADARLETSPERTTSRLQLATRESARKALATLRAATPAARLGIVLNGELVRTRPVGAGPDDNLLIDLPPMLANRVLTVVKRGGATKR